MPLTLTEEQVRRETARCLGGAVKRAFDGTEDAQTATRDVKRVYDGTEDAQTATRDVKQAFDGTEGSQTAGVPGRRDEVATCTTAVRTGPFRGSSSYSVQVVSSVKDDLY